MKSLPEIISHFARGIARSRVSLLGAMIVTIVFPFLLGALLYDVIWHIQNTYVAAVIYMVLGPIFITGLVMVFLGLFFFKGKEEVRLFTLEYLRDYFNDPTKFSRLRKLVFFAVFLTCVNLFIFGLLGYRGYHYMESVGFCGQFCHSVMNPEFTAYSNSAHSRVPCVECHIGAGATWFVKSKISGARQLFAVALDTYSRPIETPVHGLRPARDTCEECHRPEKFHGDKLVVKDDFKEDEANTHTQTVMLVKIGTAGDRAVSSHGIHWHVAPANRITYRASSWDRMDIPEVTLHKADGTTVVFKTEDADEKLKDVPEEVGVREMDCIDCHNRPTHVYLPPSQALNNKILSGAIPRNLPFIKQQAMAVVQKDYASQDEARTAIASELNAWYQKNYPDLLKKDPTLLEKAIAGVQAAYVENVFPEMNIKWNTYTSHIGHDADLGCFRCHDEEHVSESGETISMDCETCHVILAEDEANPDVIKELQGQ
jgi:NapC/NirT cytochrome c family, N-terminal region